MYSVEIRYKSDMIHLYKTNESLPVIIDNLKFELRHAEVNKITIRKYIKDTIYKIDYL